MFDDIRPYRDSEVVSVINKLVAEKELQNSVAIYTLPYIYKFFPSLARLIVKVSLKMRVKQVRSVSDVQNEMAKYLFRLIKKSTDGFSYSGLDKLDMNQPTLFVSNHRDIVLDPALVNMALFESGANTVEIAIGDNLLTKEWISDLMRLNKSFIVKRNEKTKRAMLTASKTLSAYIHHALTDNGQHIWIAQREGRAKDGLDKTNAALISMLLLNKPKELSISDYLKQLNIVPVSISYELDPCDRDKAIELATIEQTGSYQKSEHEDIQSITRGLVGQKGKVHIAFGEIIDGDFQDSKSIAAAIDKQIINNYRLFDSNNAAYELLKDNSSVPDESHLESRMVNLDANQRRWLLTMYANPVAAKKGLQLN
ncbi:cytochrome C oxidase Cbb3 [Aliikangiella marina]|uniref:Cytochrome C oxidase Cbb3 n=1 Tax=Aliikangiella marina TaxID=1712262 RepID=A0A545T564_9GAMM|nr:1-acyl-sn-glycerol-3-phosphate acyltransferase [Aliikangiella marina]TQV72343.1 cytochrome C oxidase Cbb3 [Aliikangiella marina]